MLRLNPFYNERVLAVALMDLRPKLHATSLPQSGSDKDMGDILHHRRLPRILVVDDNADTRMLMKELLSSRGYDVIAAPDAAQAEIEVLRQPPDLILSDVIMP